MAELMQDKVALVTGGSSGIGRASAMALAREGAQVAIGDVDEDGGHQTVRLIQDGGGQAMFVHADMADEVDVQSMVERTVQHFGGLDCAFNNAGVDNLHSPIGEFTAAEWDRVLNVNLRGVMLAMRYEIPRMLDRGGGAIVNCASIAGLIATPCSPAYIASKHGIIGLTRSAAIDYAKKGIRINAVCPGGTRTAQALAYLEEMSITEAHMARVSPMRRLAQPEEIAAAVLWLCCDESSYVTGHPLAVDGGRTAGTANVR